MPKDKKFSCTTVKMSSLSMAKAKMQDLATDPGFEEQKAEPQDESEIICHYYTGEEPHHCPGPMGDECHYVIKNGKMVMAHKRCHKRDQDGEKKTPKVMIR